jgi:hypothetical protein
MSRRTAVPKRITPPINPPNGSIFACPYMCSSSAGFSEAFVAIRRINIEMASRSAWAPSLKIARLPAVKPNTISTTTTLEMAHAEIFRALSLFSPACIMLK